jgi:arylsulfatase A-like enzyme
MENQRQGSTMMAPSTLGSSAVPRTRAERPVWLQVLSIAIWFGILTGLVEGCGLLLFQNLNHEILGLRVSTPIIWISPVVDVLLFCVLALIVAAVARFIPRTDPLRSTAVLLIGLSVYDFLTLTARLSSRSRILLAVGVGVAFYRWLRRHHEPAWRFCKRSLRWVVAAGLLTFVVIQRGRHFAESRAIAELPPAAPNSPNVLVIVIDTLRADHLSSYGYGHSTSPNIDALASDGVLFENAISACSWTYPSHVSLVTGRPQFEHGRNTFALSPLFHPHENIFNGYPTIGDVLQKHGYRTGAFSANRTFFVGNLGFSQGFIHFDDYFNSIPDMFARTLAGREFLRLYGKAAKGNMGNQTLEYGLHNGFRKQPSEVNEELLHWIDKSGPRPFFAFLNYLSVHAPYGAPGSPRTEPKGTTQDTALYDQGIEYTDRYIGELIQALKQRGLDKNILVIVTADHGESLGEHNFLTHGRVLYWEQIHVPLVIWDPGHVPAGTRISHPVTNVAMASTIMDLLGTDGGEFPGPALSLFWKGTGGAVSWPDPISELAEDREVFRADPVLDKKIPTSYAGAMKSLVTPRWHFIVHQTMGEQLYDWVHDPAETNDLITTPDGREIAGSLLADLAGELTEPGLSPSDRFSAVSFSNPGSGAVEMPIGVPAERNEYHRLRANSGAKLKVEVRRTNAQAKLDPVITIEDPSGHLYQTCRNRSDDHLPSPGISDPTPMAFDDACINGGFGVNTDSISDLEILVPGKPGSFAELMVRIQNWNGHGVNGADYRITVTADGE